MTESKLNEKAKRHAMNCVLASTDTKLSEQAMLSIVMFKGYDLAASYKQGYETAQQDAISGLWHPASDAPEMYRKYLIMRQDGHITGSWERHDDGFIPWSDVVKEHKFTHWCYTEDLRIKTE